MPFDFQLFYRVVPKVFKGKPVRYIKVERNGKTPVESAWQSKHNYSVEEILDWIIDGNNYGITSIDGTIVFIDADTKEIQKDLDNLAPTLHYTTGKPEHMHYVYQVDQPFKNIPLKDGAYVKGKNGFVVGIGSVHPNGTVYGKIEMHPDPIASVKSAELMEILKPYIPEKSKSIINAPPEHTKVELNEDDLITPPAQEIEAVISEFVTLWKEADNYRHNLTLAIIGWLMRKRWNAKAVYEVIKQLIDITGVGQEHLVQVQYCYNNPRKGWGLPKILEIKNEVFK